MNSQKRQRLILVVLCLAGVQAAQAVPITINSSLVVADAYDGGGSSVSDTDSSTAFGTRTLTATDGAASTTTTINWVGTDGGALFDFDFMHVRPGTQSSYALSYENYLIFTVGDENIDYLISGQYSVVDVSGSNPGAVYSFVRLFNRDSGALLVYDYSYSQNTLDESFTVGVANDGDSINSTFGSFSGTLFAGQTYGFFFQNYIQARGDSNLGASATGCVTLSLGGVTGAGTCGALLSVPEPSALSLFGAGLLGLGLLARRRNVA